MSQGGSHQFNKRFGDSGTNDPDDDSLAQDLVGINSSPGFEEVKVLVPRVTIRVFKVLSLSKRDVNVHFLTYAPIPEFVPNYNFERTNNAFNLWKNLEGEIVKLLKNSGSVVVCFIDTDSMRSRQCIGQIDYLLEIARKNHSRFYLEIPQQFSPGIPSGENYIIAKEKGALCAVVSTSGGLDSGFDFLMDGENKGRGAILLVGEGLLRLKTQFDLLKDFVQKAGGIVMPEKQGD